jgi:hypothetical protein
VLNCIYCEVETFAPGKGSEEHVILSSLGGKKGSRNICCQSCNNKYGDDIDEELSKELSFFSTMLDITTGRNKPAPTHDRILTHQGKDYDLSPGGNFRLSKADVKITDIEGANSQEVAITAGNEEQAIKILNQVLRRYNKTIDDFSSLDAKSVRTYVPTIHQRISLGGEKQLRSITKMMLSYTATLISPERLRSGCFQEVINYIKGVNSDYSGTQFDCVSNLPKLPSVKDINHRIFFISSKSRKLGVGFIELFGKLRFSSILTDKWDGESIGRAYAIDPVSGEQENIEFDVDNNLFTSLDQRGIDYGCFQNAVSQLVETFQQRQSDQVISVITEKAIERHMVSKGEYITKEMIQNVAQEVALEFVRFSQRLESEEDIDLK